VDNIVTGVNSPEEAVRFYKESKSMFNDASMNLREWVSNSTTVNEFIPEKDRSDVRSTKVLGHIWNIENDTLSLKPTKVSNVPERPTKRSTLKEIAEVFDSLGLLAPLLIRGKFILQDLWRKHLDWDDEIDDKDLECWNSIKADIRLVTAFAIPRNILLNTDSRSQEVKYKLLCFCDASARAYATAVYLHQYCNGYSKCDLIFSKARLAPVKTMTIPRLELLAVLIGIRCLKLVKGEVKLPFSGVLLWTDSQCVLKCITTSKDLSVFVKNRIVEIKSEEGIQFKYVPSKQNPADLATRGRSVESLRNDNLWWHGPEWLTETDSEWNRKQSTPDKTTEEMKFKSELKKTKTPETKDIQSLVGMDNCCKNMKFVPPFGIHISRFSSFTKLMRVTAWVNRFVSKLNKTSSYMGVLTSVELHEAEMLWILFVERKATLESRQTKNLQRQLGTFSDECEVIRCKGRLENAGITEGAKYPILLHRKERFTHLLIDKIHRENFHCGVSQTIVSIRQRFWIPKIRSTVKYVLHRCLMSSI
jgi:ribonuclease HI